LLEQFELYLRLLLEWNAIMNLTAIRDPEEIRVRLFEDSLKLLDFADFRGKRVLDVGSGAGFPGLALKIAEPSIDLTLLDSTGKKVDFLRRVAGELKLGGVSSVHGRAEEYARTGARESFDLVCARGVAALPALCELCLPFLRVGGTFLAMKGSLSESADVSALGGKRGEARVYTLSDGTVHYLVRVEKTAETNFLYPRPWGAIKKKPLV
jgi:16S rRNA (guanine527-N7)-methyltransferase